MLSLHVSSTDPREVDADVVAVPVFKGGIEGPGTQLLLQALGLDRLPVTPTFRGDVDQTLLLAAPGLRVGAVLLVGLGRMDEVDPARLRRAAGAAVRAVGGSRRVATTLSQVASGRPVFEAIGEGFVLGAQAGVQQDRKWVAPSEAELLVVSSQLAEARAALRRAATVSRATVTARELVQLPPDAKRPPELAERIAAQVRDACTVRVLGERELSEHGCGGLLAVGRGSSAPPQLVELRYRPSEPLGSVALVGKGITFDTGGINLKRDASITEMKSDMAGAAAVAATVGALAELDVRLEVVGRCALAENMPGADAQRPSDVLTTAGGQRVEVLDTDAEGRLVLADALELAVREEPDAVVDLATLTGSAVTAVGRLAAALMGNDADLTADLRAAAQIAGEPLWPLPLWPDLDHLLESDVADLNNTGDGAGAGAIMGGLFLQRFVAGTPWAHLDIAGPAYLPPELAKGELSSGGTGFGVRTLLAWLQRRA